MRGVVQHAHARSLRRLAVVMGGRAATLRQRRTSATTANATMPKWKAVMRAVYVDAGAEETGPDASKNGKARLGSDATAASMRLRRIRRVNLVAVEMGADLVGGEVEGGVALGAVELDVASFDTRLDCARRCSG